MSATAENEKIAEMKKAILSETTLKKGTPNQVRGTLLGYGELNHYPSN
jgi:hypothetical protein